MRAHLPKYATGTTFETTLRALAKLSHAATVHCSPIMAAAAHAMHDHSTTATEKSTETAPGADNDNHRTSPPKDNASNQQKTNEPIASYLAIVQRPPTPPKITRIPRAAGTDITQPSAALDVSQAVYSSKLRTQEAKLNNKLLGDEEKNLLLVESDAPLAAPTHLRHILTFGGIGAPLVVLPTTDSTKMVVCAPDSALSAATRCYETFTDVCRSERRRPPKISFKAISVAQLASADQLTARLILHAIRKEGPRLESTSCEWKTRHYFARRLLELENIVHGRCVALEGEGAPLVFPENPQLQRRNKRTSSAISSDGDS